MLLVQNWQILLLAVSLTSRLLLASSVCDLRNLSKLVKKLFYFGSGQDCEWCWVWLPTGSVLTGIVFSDLASFSDHFIFFLFCAVSFKPAWWWGLFKTLKSWKRLSSSAVLWCSHHCYRNRLNISKADLPDRLSLGYFIKFSLLLYQKQQKPYFLFIFFSAAAGLNTLTRYWLFIIND